MAAALLASSSVVANPLIIFWRFTGGGVGGRDAGGVGGLLKLLCCENKHSNDISKLCCGNCQIDVHIVQSVKVATDSTL